MRHPVSPFGQPHPFGCLPTCVQAVRDFYQEKLTYDDASELCAEIPEGGCIWEDSVAFLSLQYDVQTVAESDDTIEVAFEKLKEVVASAPIIVHLLWEGWAGSRHAVVIIEISDNAVIIMNPAAGVRGSIESLSYDDFKNRWEALGFGAFYFEE